jgi:hypothetical protein
MIFLSHTSADKPVVEPVAIALREIYGEAKVFYDAWSIRPGDGIIDRMNEGLASPEFVFFFVSANSLKSVMVNLEWQNALMKATKGQCRLIPVRVDGTPMPPLLLQSLYIDMFGNGVEAATRQIENAVQGNASFTRQHAEFSNLTWTASGDPKAKVLVTVSASHVMEPRPSFGFVLRNTLGEVGLWIEGAPAVRSGPDSEEAMPNGAGKRLLLRGSPFDGAPITPAFPLVFRLTARSGATINLEAVLHQVSPTYLKAIPQAA